MNKLRMESKDMVDENVKKIGELFPNCITETKDAQGRLKRSIKWDVLKEALSGEYVEGGERYEFMWPGKKAAYAEAMRSIRKTLRPCREESKNWDATENLYIEGDNLEVLKLLQESYLGKVKMIYIDPPYNTGHDFVYRDNFQRSQQEENTQLGLFDEDESMLFENTESNGRFHSDWCSMIYSRLMLARNLLSDDGVIFISIDDNEQGNLRKICDEVFGASNFIGILVLKTATDNNPSQINTEHEYMICYAKNRQVQMNWLRISEAAKKIMDKHKELKNRGLSVEDMRVELRKWIKTNKDSLPQVAHYNCVDEKGVYSSSGNSSNPHLGGYMYDIISIP